MTWLFPATRRRSSLLPSKLIHLHPIRSMFGTFVLWDEAVSRFGRQLTSRLMQQLLLALEHVAQCGICHQDVKPENLMLYDLSSLPEDLQHLDAFRDFQCLKQNMNVGRCSSVNANAVQTKVFCRFEISTNQVSKKSVPI